MIGKASEKLYRNTLNMEGGRSKYRGDPTKRVTLAPYVFCIQFTCKGYLSLELGISWLRGRKIL